MNLRRVLFWDTDVDQIDYQKHASYVIERIVTYGSLNEWRQILEFYGRKKIIETVTRLRNLDDKSLNYLSHKFQIPKDQFRCYNKKQSAQPPFHY